MLNITPPSGLGATVCARCFVHLLVRRRPVPIFSRRLSSRRTPQEGEPTTVDPVEPGRRERRRSQYAVLRLRPGHQPELRFGHGDRDVREQTAKLESTSLGKPLNVVLLKKGKGKRRAGQTDTAGPSPADGNHPGSQLAQSLTASLDDDKRPVTFEKVKKAIDGFRPQTAPGHPHAVLTRHEVQRLAAQLCHSFTFDQLRRYFEYSKKQLRAPLRPDASTLAPGLQESADRNAPVLMVGVWRPGVKSYDLTNDLPTYDHLAVQLPAVGGQKDVVVRRIFGDCWKIRVQHDADVVGQVDVNILRQNLDALLTDERSPLKVASARHQARLDLSRQTGRIRITATQNNATAVVEEIRGVLAAVQRIIVDLVPLRATSADPNGRSHLPTHDFMKAVARMTGMGFRMLHATDTIELSTLGTSTAVLETSKRLLLARVESPFNRRYSAITPWKLKSHLSKMALYPVHSPSRMPWTERSRSWARLRVARPREEGERGPGGVTTAERLGITESSEGARDGALWGLVEHDIGSRELHRGHEPAGTVPTSSEHVVDGPDAHLPSVRWATTMHEVTVANIGYVLRDEASAGSHPVPTRMDDERRRASWKCSFLPDVPGLARSVASRYPHSAGPKREMLVITLKPSPWASSYAGTASTAFPAMEVLLEVDHVARETRLARVHAIIERRVCDILLPHRVADLRFTSRLCLNMEHPEQSPIITDFLNRSRLDLWGDQQLEAASSLRLPIPRRILSGSLPEEHLEKELPEVEMEYLFASLEFRQTVDLMDDEGVRAQYTLVEGGKTGGRHSEVTFTSENASTSSSEEGGEDKEDKEEEKNEKKDEEKQTDQPLKPVKKRSKPTIEQILQKMTPVEQREWRRTYAYLGNVYDAAYDFLNHLDRYVPGGLQPVEQKLERDADGDETEGENEMEGSISINIDMDTNVAGHAGGGVPPSSAAAHGS
ncbi:MAG: 3'-5' exonuclease [Watsoniomyces obsoletus]|nr:MAG: 3'-5' exonuclease [Watsoniomyces obsoletus]